MSVIPTQRTPSPASRRSCPSWCVTEHGAHLGEEDWVHSSAPVTVADGVEASTCTTIDPLTGEVDGPYILVGCRELTPRQAAALADQILSLVEAAESVTPPAAF